MAPPEENGRTQAELLRGMNKLQGEILRAIIRFEMRENRRTALWRFESDGVSQIFDDFLLFNEYINHHQKELIQEFCDQWKDFVLDAEDKRTIDALPEAQRADARIARLSPVLLPIWLLLAAVCHVLQEAENPLTATDAFWLGLIDEVIGVPLPTLRQVLEAGTHRSTRRASATKTSP